MPPFKFFNAKLLPFLLLSFTVFSSFSQNNFAIVSYGTTNYFPREIFFGDTGEVYFAGQCSIRGSINNEVSWNGYCYTPLYIMGGCSPSLANTFVVGKNGLISKNSGCEIFGSWSNQNSGTSDTLYSIKFYDINTGVIVGQNGRILRTTNNGILWSPISSGTSASLRNLIIKPDSTLLACGATGTILSSPDKGITWNPQTTGINTLLNDICFPTNDTGYAVGRGGVMIKTTDAGSTWNAVNTGVILNINAIDFVDANTGVIVGDDGLILRTTDGGSSWTTFPFSSSNDMADVKFKNKLVGYFAGTFDSYKTVDGGLSWFNMGSNLEAVKYLNDTTLVAVGDNIVRKSNDGGLHWNAQHPLPGTSWYDAAFPAPDTGYICGSGGRIMKTIDGGQSYTQQVSNAPVSGGNYYFGIHFFDKNKGIAIGSQYMISRTTNGGFTWTTTYSSSASGYSFYDVFFINNQVGWICGSKGNIRKTTDGGATFTNQPSGVQKFLWSIYFLNPLKGFACGETGTLLKTLDGGTTWTNTTLSNSSSLYSIAFRDSLHGYISGDSQLLFVTNDGGTSWKYNNNYLTMRAITFRNAYTGFAVGVTDTKLIFDPIKTFNGYARVCKGSNTSFVPKLVSGITINPTNNYIMEMDTSGDDFNDALFLGVLTDTATTSYWYFNIPQTLKAGIYKTRVRATATSPVHRSMLTDMTVYDDARAAIRVRNDTLFTIYNPKYVYQWRQGFTLLTGENKYYYVPTGPGTYRVDVQYGCCNEAYDKVTISICSGGILIEPILANNYAVICDSSAAILTASGASSYHWYESDTSSVILDTTASFTTPILTARDTFYVATFNDSCESNRVAYYIQFTSKPIPPIAIGDSVCAGNEAFLFTLGNNYTHWFTDSLSTLDLQTAASFHIPNLLTNDTFYVSNFNYQCESNRIAVIAYAIDNPIPTSISGDTTVLIGDTVSYFYTQANGNTVEWFVIGGSLISTNDSLVVKWDSTSTGRVGIIESNVFGCKSDTLWLSVNVDLGVAIPEPGVEQFSISPNPATNKIVVECTNAGANASIFIRDNTGKLVLTTMIVSGRKQIIMDISKLSAGTYYLKYGSTAHNQRKFVILR